MKSLICKFNKSSLLHYDVLVCLLILILSACSPSPEEIAIQTAQAATVTASSWTPMPTATLTPEPIIPKGGYLFISLSKFGSSTQAGNTGLGAFTIDLNSQDISKILDSNQGLEAVSSDGSQIVYSQGNELYLKDINDNKSSLIADNFKGEGISGIIPNGNKVMWLEKTNEIVFVGQDRESEIPGIYVCNTDGSNIRVITGSGDRPIDLLGFNDNGVYWEFGYITEDPEYGEITNSEGLRFTTLDGERKSPGVYQYSYQFALSSNGEEALYSPMSGMGNNPIFIINMEDNSRISFLNNDCVDPDLQEVWAGLSQSDYLESYAVWSPDSNQLLVELSVRNIETVETTYSSQVIFSKKGERIFTISESGASNLVRPILTWSPDSKYCLLGSFDGADIWDAVNFEIVHSVYLPPILNEIDISGNIDKIFWVE